MGTGDPLDQSSSEDRLRATATAPAATVAALTQDEFSLTDSIGGLRGLIESVAPGLVFVVVYVSTHSLSAALISALTITMVTVVARLIQRASLQQAMSGVIGIVIGAAWAYFTGAPEDYFAPGLYINAAYLLVLLATMIAGWPVVGVLFGFFTERGFSWRDHSAIRRRYQIATGVLAVIFVLRLAVQVPLYIAQNVAALGIARLAMGVPLWVLGLWLAWVIANPKVIDPLYPPAASESDG